MEIHYTWEIEGFPTKTEELKSPAFSGIFYGRLLEWSITLFPKGTDNTDECVHARLNLETSNTSAPAVWFKLSFINSLDMKFDGVQPSPHLIFFGDKDQSDSIKSATFGFSFEKVSTFGRPRNPHEFNSGVQSQSTCDDRISKKYFWLRRDIIFNKDNRILIDGNILRVHCCISSKSVVNHCIDHYNIAMSGENPNFGLWELYQHQRLVDFTINVKGKHFKVHKSIFAARSEVFAAWFNHDLKENAENGVDILDIEPEVFKEIVRFVYLDVVDCMEEFAVDLLVCADKYNLRRLKALCVRWLSETLSVANAADICLAAFSHNAPILKVRAIAFIAANLKKVMETAGWKEVPRYENLSNALFQELC